ncbi:hypothetical protein [Miltoncostaea marina]|uniref:hypothetical protein n=1 Tax=Miltoncostaea marina TaxID=2843215 RepID=UPI001C3C1CC7|nr:hypothetical protein [Miltoncostaea marina]
MSTSSAISDEELQVVARVATREGWTDPATPPETHAPRTLDEELAVGRFLDAAAPPARPRGPWMTPLRARILMVVLAVGVLGACWAVSPARTAIGLIGAGVFSLVALRRRQRRERAGHAGAAPRGRRAWGAHLR